MAIPSHLQKYFWGDNLEDLDLFTHSNYINQTILDKGDLDSVRWLFGTYSEKKIQSQLPKLKLSQKSANYWKIYFS